MKHSILINDRKYKIKPISDLSTCEFIQMSKLGELDFIKYIAWQTGLSTNEAFFAVVSKSVEKLIGAVPNIQKLPRHKMFDYSKTIQTVGQRHQIESCGLSGYELLVYVLAVSQTQSLNSDEVQKKVNEYMLLPFTTVLPSGFFFFKNLRNGKKLDRISSVLRWVLTWMQKLKRRRAPKG